MQDELLADLIEPSYGFVARGDTMRVVNLPTVRDDGTILAADKKPYGDVPYADPGYQKDGKKRYPVDTPAHIRAAWSYINHPKNAGQYSKSQLAHIKAKIVSAWKSKIDKSGPPSA